MLFSAQTPIESINANIQSAHPTANAQVWAVIGEKQVEETALFDLRLTITEDDYTCDSRGTPFFFWSSVDDDFSEATTDFKSVVFYRFGWHKSRGGRHGRRRRRFGTG